MSTINVLGPVGYNPTGTYDPTRAYEKLDVVYYQGSSYVATNDSIGQLPTNTEYWDCIAAGSLKQFVYDTVADMKADNTLSEGMIAQTLGYYSIEDNGSARYIIKQQEASETIDNGRYIPLNNGLIAKLVIDECLTPEQFGARGNGTNDDSDYLINMFNTPNSLYMLTKNYKITKELNISNIPNGSKICGGGKIFATSSLNGNRRNIFKIGSLNNIIITNLTFESTNDQTPYVPSDHSARTGSLSSNIVAINLYKVKNSYFNNLNFINMCYDFHIQGHEENAYGNENIYLNNLTDNGGAMGVYADNINNLYINNYYMKPYTNPVGGMHMFYISRYVGKVYISNVEIDGNNKTDVVFDFANFYDSDPNDSYNSDIIVDKFYVKANSLIAVKRLCKNIQLNNGIFDCMYQINESNANYYGYACMLFHEVVDNVLLYPTIKFNNVTFNYIENDKKQCYLFSSSPINYGKAIFKNCTVNNMPVQYLDTDVREEVEFYNSDIYDTLKFGVFKIGVNPSYADKDDITPCGIYRNCTIHMKNQFIFSNRYATNFKLIIENNEIINDSGSGTSILYNSNLSSGDVVITRNDYKTTGTSFISGLNNTPLVQYLNYVNGTLYETT